MLLHSPQNGLEIQLMGSKVHRQCVSVKREGIHGPVVPRCDCSCFTLLCSTVATFQVLILFSHLCIHMAHFSDFVNNKTDSMITFMFPQHAYFGRILTVWINTICLCIVRTSSINKTTLGRNILSCNISSWHLFHIVKKEKLWRRNNCAAKIVASDIVCLSAGVPSRHSASQWSHREKYKTKKLFKFKLR